MSDENLCQRSRFQSKINASKSYPKKCQIESKYGTYDRYRRENIHHIGCQNRDFTENIDDVNLKSVSHENRLGNGSDDNPKLKRPNWPPQRTSGRVNPSARTMFLAGSGRASIIEFIGSRES
jgi:hypothetical protein